MPKIGRKGVAESCIQKNIWFSGSKMKTLFSPLPPPLYKHRGATSAVQQVSYHFKIYKGSKALDYFPLKYCSSTLGALACFLVF